MRHLDLFSGIGGFALAARNVWGKQHEIVSFCEIDPFCQKVLKKHWPDTPIQKDIKEFNCNGLHADLITGGWPCQDISVAGNGTGLNGARSGLWRDLHRIVEQVRPAFCIFENSPMLKSRGYQTVKLDMERIGYRIRPFVADARLFGADQRRIRVYLVAYNVCDRSKRYITSTNLSKDGQGGARSETYLSPTLWRNRPLCNSSPESLLCRSNDGIPNRTHRLKSLGNAIVPQIAAVIMQAIKEAENA